MGASTGAPTPLRMWTLNEDFGGRKPGEEDSIWVVFKSHEEVSGGAKLLSFSSLDAICFGLFRRDFGTTFQPSFVSRSCF
jgi:hypothetical protein